MDCDAGSSRGEGFRRGDSAPGLPRGVGFGSRAGGSGSLRSPFVDVDSPSLPMVTARSPRGSAARASGSAARGGERLSGGAVRGTTAARWRASGAQRLGRGGAYRARGGCGFRPAFFRTTAWGRSCRVSTELSALKAIMRHGRITTLPLGMPNLWLHSLQLLFVG